ncbi:alpha/beta hydrolase [Catenovulum sp. 2E275]|uniref:alpha/beta hydrolase n=1 Tax=Catenovulum sp. 2E275 TaxID=2980497 RepID=UPI0021CE3BBF|nr:alpha/beta hydrolase [Catenovulum sp. 2E275]MCU4675893.1 alpha/beta hydrolase [Catenovulum sp. 2E275]
MTQIKLLKSVHFNWLIRVLAVLISYLSLSFVASAEPYQLKTNISYYPQSQISTDYQQSQSVLDLYYPTDKKSFATIVWFHGGGLRGGHKEIPQALKNQGFAVAGVGYRLFPKVKSPVYIQDAAAATAWVFQHIEAFGGDKSKIFIAGHSAGGYLTSMLGLDKRWLAKYQIDANDIAGLIPFSGHAITHFTVREERGIKGEQPIVDDLAPLFHVRADAPPFILITGDRNLEMLGRYEENAFLWRMMKVNGHQNTQLFELQGYDHGAMAQPAFHILINQINQLLQDKRVAE